MEKRAARGNVVIELTAKKYIYDYNLCMHLPSCINKIQTDGIKKIMKNVLKRSKMENKTKIHENPVEYN